MMMRPPKMLVETQGRFTGRISTAEIIMIIAEVMPLVFMCF